MKKILFSFITLTLICVLSQNTFAESTYRVEYVYGNDPYYVRTNNDKYYISNNSSGEDLVFYSQGVTSGYYDGITKIYLPAQTLTISDYQTGELLFKDEAISFVELDSTDAFHHGMITIKTGAKSYIWYADQLIDKIVISLDKAKNYDVVFKGSQKINLSVDDVNQLKEITKNIKVYSSIEGDLTQKIYIKEDTYSSNFKYIGQHKIIFAVVDKFGTEYSYQVDIFITDQTPPKIEDKIGDLYTSYTKKLTLDEIISGLEVTDNNDLIVPIGVKEDMYSEVFNQVKVHYMIFNAIDRSGNVTLYKKMIHVIDDIAPKISGPKEIHTVYQNILSKADILKQMTYTDDITIQDKIAIEWIKDTYTGSNKTIGKYKMSINFKDEAGNKAQHDFEVVVDAPKSNIVDLGILECSMNQPLTINDIRNFLIEKAVIINANDPYTLKIDEYTASNHKPGAYRYMIEKENKSYQFLIKVNQNEEKTKIENNQLETKDYLMIALVTLLIGFIIFYIYQKIRKHKTKQ